MPTVPGDTKPSFGWPIAGPVTQEYGHNGHPGIDISAPNGTPIAASAAGRCQSAAMNNGGYGNLVILDHGAGWSTYYAHQQKFHIATGQTVSAGGIIGEVDSTGNSTGPHLHFEIRKDGATTNPRASIAGNPSAGNTATGGQVTWTPEGGIVRQSDTAGAETSSNPLDALAGLAGFAGKLADGKTWMRVLMVVGGIGLGVGGVIILTRDTWEPAAKVAAEVAVMA